MTDKKIISAVFHEVMQRDADYTEFGDRLITNVMNDQYCYQTSKKIRQVFDYKRHNGKYIALSLPMAI